MKPTSIPSLQTRHFDSPEIESRHQTFLKAFQHIGSQKKLRSLPFFQENQKALEETLHSYQMFAPQKPFPIVEKKNLRIASWNIERGKAFQGILHSLLHHPDLSKSDVWVLTEVDVGMARSENRHVAQDLAKELNCYGVFAPAFLNLSKGHGGEKHIEGTNSVSLQGHAILSRFPIEEVKLIPLPKAKDHMKGPEKQIGQERALLTTLQTPSGSLQIAAIHLESYSSRKQRKEQMKAVIQALEPQSGPILLAGDWNTTTYSSRPRHQAILDFVVKMMLGRKRVMDHHYPWPERFFEKRLFSLLHNHGFQTQEFNVPGAYTYHFDFNDPVVRSTVSDWMPRWCFTFADWALKPRNGLCSLKLDWFAGRELKARNSFVIGDLGEGPLRYSDHDAIVTDIDWIPRSRRRNDS